MLCPLLQRMVWSWVVILCIWNGFCVGSEQQEKTGRIVRKYRKAASHFAASVDDQGVLTADVKELTHDIKREELDSRALLTGREELDSRALLTGPLGDLKKKVNKLLDAAIENLKSPSRTEELLPQCLRSGGSIADCVQDDLSSKANWIEQQASALQSGLDNFVTCPGYAALRDALKDLAKGIECTPLMSMTYPSGINTSWEPQVLTTSKSFCTTIGGLNVATLKGLQGDFAQCARGLYDAVATGINAAKAIDSICECKADFGVYFGADFSVAAVVSSSIATGLIVGCDGCHFQYKPWWSYFGGVTTNLAVDAGLILGFASTWASFWGQALVFEAGGGPNVVAANVGVGTTLPELSIQTSTVTVKKKKCFSGLCWTAKRSLDVPSAIHFVPPAFATIDFAITAGLSLLPIDGTAGFATTYAID